MKQKTTKQVVIIGSGNVAWHLAWILTSLQTYRVAVYNHKANPQLKRFQRELGSDTGSSLAEVPGDADYYFICVADRAISGVAKQLKIRNPKAILAHTSGSAELTDLGVGMCARAVFYPLQSFSAQTEVRWKEVPLLIETQDQASYVQLKRLGERLSGRVVKVNYAERLRFHLAAVFVNNFTNALYVAASDLLSDEKSSLSFDLLQPLIQQTTAKMQVMNPRDAQTGPAKRGDKPVMKKHLALLEEHKDLQKLYKQLSKLIKKQQR